LYTGVRIGDELEHARHSKEKMESQQMMELLLDMKAMQERAEAERKSDREEMIARMDANTKAKQATQVKMNETMQENI
jgi:hypothetical protein